MKGKTLLHTLSTASEVSLVAITYVVTARLGQYFAIEPGNITPVWLPSGIMLAWVILRGYYIWPGIFAGAFLGNIWAYAITDSFASLLPAIGAATFNGIGDAICTLGTVWALRRMRGRTDPFASFYDFLTFIGIGVMLGPLVSAVFGVTSLLASGFLVASSYWDALVTWWVGDGIGVLLITPFILSLRYKGDVANPATGKESIAFILCLLGLTVLCWSPKYMVSLIANPGYFMVPILFWAIIRLGLRFAFGTALYVVAMSIIAAPYGGGFFRTNTTTDSVMALQVFIFIVVSSIFIAAFMVREKILSLAKLQEDYYRDGLTGLCTRNFLDLQLHREIEAAKRKHSQFCLLMYDLDHFKRVNDSFGHLAGDYVLQEISRIVAAQIRTNDTLARWGGEEFVILMPDTELGKARIFSERLRRAVEKAPILKNIVITISIGVIQFNINNPIAREFDRVDSALYRAKNNGRNRVEVDRTNGQTPEPVHPDEIDENKKK